MSKKLKRDNLTLSILENLHTPTKKVGWRKQNLIGETEHKDVEKEARERETNRQTSRRGN